MRIEAGTVVGNRPWNVWDEDTGQLITNVVMVDDEACEFTYWDTKLAFRPITRKVDRVFIYPLSCTVLINPKA